MLENGNELLTPPQVARLMKVNPATVYRWTSEGVKDRAGKRIRLDCHRIGGRLRIERGSLEGFFDRLGHPEWFGEDDKSQEENERRLRPRPIKSNGHRKRTDKERERAMKRAERELNHDGL